MKVIEVLCGGVLVKKYIVLVITLLLIALGVVYLSTDVFKPVKELSEMET